MRLSRLQFRQSRDFTQILIRRTPKKTPIQHLHTAEMREMGLKYS